MNALLPVEFTVRNEAGMKYFENLDITASEPVYTKVWGRVNCMTSTTIVNEESAFGESAVKVYERKSKSWDVTGTAKVEYDFGDEKVMTVDELTKASQDRQVYLADIKRRTDEYRAKKAGSANAFSAGATPSVAAAKTGDFHF